jgi:hypothetical protein
VDDVHFLFVQSNQRSVVQWVLYMKSSVCQAAAAADQHAQQLLAMHQQSPGGDNILVAPGKSGDCCFCVSVNASYGGTNTTAVDT